MDLSTSNRTIGGRAVLGLRGEVDLASLPRLHDALLRLVSEHPGAAVIVDLDGVVALDDSGLGLVLGAAARAREAGGDLVVVCTNERLRQRFQLSGFDRAVAVHASIAATS